MSINIAVSKGRVFKAFVKILKNKGFEFDGLKGRKLIIPSKDKSINLIVVKSSDVPLYVKNSFAELGVAGRDVIDEYENVFYELLDLDIGSCDLCIAGKEDLDLKKDPLTIATKYPKQASNYLKQKNKKGKIIKLNGSVELGPILGISDCILDIVETGTTLKENDLVVKEHFKEINSLIISNKIFYKTKFNLIDNLIKKIKE
ncbi:MAG: ATP phosphoribosyltransferase [Bacillota bacterium]